MSAHGRQSALGAPRKRKERDAPGAPAVAVPPKAEPSLANNRLLAGYLAHEFLTKGTLFGQRWDPARVNSAKLQKQERTERANSVDPVRSELEPEPAKPKPGDYAEVARLMRVHGVQIPGIVNPSQLARWLHM